MANNRELSQLANVVGYNGGNIGIGIDNPSQNLHVSAASGTRIQVSHTGGSVDALLGTDSGNAFTGTSTNHDFRIITNNGERVRITSGGRVGINSISPATALDIQSTKNSDGLTITKAGTRSAFLGHNGSGNEGLLTLKEGGTTRIQLYAETNQDSYINSGDFGIGTNSPSTKLDVRPTAEDPTTGSPAAGAFSQIRADDATVGKGPSLSLMNLSGSKETGWRLSALTASGNNGDFTIHGYGGGATYSEYVRITAAGKMGLGTASPNHRLTLHQSGTGTFDALNITSGLTNVNGLQLGIDSGSNVFLWHTANGAIKFATNNSERMRVFGTGACLQINTTGTPTTGGFQLPQISIKQTAGNWTGGIHIESSSSTRMGVIASTEDGLELSQSYRSGTSYAGILFRTGGVVRSKLLSNGYFQMGSGYLGSTNYHRFNGINDTQGDTFFVLSGYQGSGGSSGDTAIFNSCNTGASTNSSAAAMRIFRNSSTTRSINASGTINASGADYAEYMTKAGNFTLAKGDVCGVNSEGKLTNVFADAISFVVKSTDPSYVGGDKWHEVAGEEPGGYDDTRTEEEIAAAKVVYEEALESARQLVDRIAFSGQVPVNVTGATPGQHIIPTAASDGSIEGIAKAEADLTMAEYMSSVGKVIAIEDDGRARIIVKVA